MTIEIDNKRSNHVLAAKSRVADALLAQLSPQQLLCFGLIVAQIPDLLVRHRL